MDEQPRVTDLIPMRWSLYLLLLVGGVAIIAGFEALYAWSLRLSSLTTDGCIAAFDLDAEGSLAAWFSSIVLLFAGLAAILVYMVRRHRKDDYQGYYRVWLWAAACCFLMSVDEGSSLHEGFKELMAMVTGTRLWGDGSIWWVIPYFFLLGSVGTRLLVEMRPCRLSTAALMGTAACFGVAILAQLGGIMPDEGAREVMVEEGAEMLGDVLLLLAMMLHARYVILDAQGLLPVRKPKVVAEQETTESTAPPTAAAAEVEIEEEEEEAVVENEEDEAEADETSSITVHPPHGVPRPASPAVLPAKAAKKPSARLAAVAAQASKPIPAISEPPEPQPKRKMTKAERKAMRKRLNQMRAEREERLRGE
jgi:hypothetical protein